MEHRTLTGDDLHEPKGVEAAANGSVYVANGSGSGSWISRFSGLFTANQFAVSLALADISTPSSAFTAVPASGQITSALVVLSATIAGTNPKLTIYKNSIAQSPVITVATTGSGAGVKTTATIDPAISAASGDVLEVRSDGASDNTAVASIVLRLTATA